MDDKNRSKTDVLEQIYVYITLVIFFLSMQINIYLFRHDVYNRLGLTTLTHDTTAWPKVRKFLNQISSQHKNALIADIGMFKIFN
jgi:hypothetical protein